MRVGLVLERFDAGRGGLERWTCQFATKLVLAGHDVHVIACEFVSPAAELPVSWHRVEASPSPIRRAQSMEQVLRGLSLDIIHDMGCGWQADIFHPHGGSPVAAWKHNLMRIPRWRQFRLWREKRYREQEAIEKRQQANAGAVFVAVSRMVRDHLETLHQIPRERICVIPNGVDTQWFSPATCRDLKASTRQALGILENEVVFVMVAHNLRLKNAEAAIRSSHQLSLAGHAVRLLIVGGKRPAPFLRLTEKLGLRNKVIFLDSTPDVRPYYAAADVHLHPTWYDPCSLVALEALACGLPVITTSYNGVSEMMTDGQQGFVVDPPSDITALADKMRRILDPVMRKDMGIAARRLAESHTMDRQTTELLTLYAEQAKQKR